MPRYTCPSCGADLPFQSSISVYAVCASCGSTVIRTDQSLEAIGTVASLPDEISPLQVGTGLAWLGRRYTLLGRVRVGWEDGAWTEWFLDDGSQGRGWLTEAQGLLAVSFERDLPDSLARSALPGLGDRVEVAGSVFRVADIKRGTCLGSEGELPFAAPKGRVATYVDMVGATAEFAGLEDAAEGRRLYVGSYATFDQLGFSHLRAVEGWPAPQVADRQLDPRYAPLA